MEDRDGLPWVTLLVAGLAILVFFIPGASSSLVYDRALILGGGWWRLWTGHWVHFSGSHLGWNLAVLVPAGIWAERLAPVRTRWLLVVAPGLIGCALVAFVPELDRYGGLSGLAAGVLAWLALIRRDAPGADRWFWNVVLTLLAFKIVAELGTGRPLLANLGQDTTRPVPAAHLAGIGCAVAARFIPRRRQK